MSGPSGCWPGGPGWVDIEELEVEPDKTVSKLRVLFICGESFGEVRIGVDSPTAATRLQPQRIRWPIVERERRGLTVPVLVSQDTGSAAVGAATVIGPQAAAFPIVENECTGKTLTAGQTVRSGSSLTRPQSEPTPPSSACRWGRRH
ncbi:MAG: hypothetical protein JHC84_11085 [Solirubrobacteraceae bacterium]|nr:hypothetical protein [Solirubrobacteraceae bacterium]